MTPGPADYDPTTPSNVRMRNIYDSPFGTSSARVLMNSDE